MPRDPLTAKGIDSKTVEFLRERILYPDQEVIFTARGEIANTKEVKRGVICLTNRSFILFQPKENRAWDYDFAEIEGFSHKRSFWSSKMTLSMKSRTIATTEPPDVVQQITMEGIPKGQEEEVRRLVGRTIENRRRFEDKQRSNGLFRFCMDLDKWGAKEQVQQWLEQYLTRRGFKKLDNTWVTAEEYLDHRQREKGLYKYVEVGVEQWASIDQILDRMSPSRFQEFIGLLFSSMGYEVTKLPYTGDYGADLLVRRGGETAVVQVKKYGPGNKVGAQEVQKTLGSTWKYKANRAVLITTSSFTMSANEQARDAPIELWNGERLMEMLRRYLPSDLFSEDPFKVQYSRVRELEKTLEAIYAQAVSQADPRTAARMKFELNIAKRQCSFSFSGPLASFPLVEQAARDILSAMPIELRRFFEAWLRRVAKHELEYVYKSCLSQLTGMQGPVL